MIERFYSWVVLDLQDFADTSHGGRSETHERTSCDSRPHQHAMYLKNMSKFSEYCMRAGEGNDHDGWTCSLLLCLVFAERARTSSHGQKLLSIHRDILISCSLGSENWKIKTMLEEQ